MVKIFMIVRGVKELIKIKRPVQKVHAAFPLHLKKWECPPLKLMYFSPMSREIKHNINLKAGFS